MPTGPEDRNRLDESVAERLATLAAWVGEIDSRVHAAEVATGDEKTAKELRKALEALAKHDPKLEKRLTDRVDVLADRLSTLGSTVSTTAAALAGKEGEIAGLRRELDKSGEQIEALMQQLKRTAGAADVERLQRMFAAAAPEKGPRRDDKRVDELRGKVDYLTERLDTLAKTVGATAAGVSGREGDLALLRERLDESSKHVQLTLVDLQRRLEDTDLVERVDSLATAVAQTSSVLATRESETAAVRARLDDSYARVGTVVTEIRESIEALAAQVAALEKVPGAAEQALESRAAELDARLSTLGERVESVAAGVTAALTGVSDREAELASLTARVDEASSRVDAVGAELRGALAELPEPGTVDPEVESRLEILRGTVSAVTSQLEALDSASSDRAKEAAARAAELEQMLAEVAERLDAVERERDAAATELTRAAESWASEREWVRGRLEEISAAHADTSDAQDALAPQLSALTERLAAMESEREVLGADIARVSQALDEERASLHAELEALGARLAEAASVSTSDESERLLAELGERLDAVERDGVAASELARAAAAWGEEREWVHQRLEEISAANADTSHAQDVLAPLAELGSRLDAVERDGAAVASEVARAASYWASELDSLETRLDRALATPQGEAATPVAGATDELLTRLAERVEAMERDRDSLTAEIGRVSTAWASDRSSLEGRLEQVATHLDEVEAAAGAAAPAASSGNEVEQLRVQVEGLRMRLAASEKELTAFTGSREVASRLDELARRIDSVERVAMAPSVVVSSSGAPVPGDGRFRLELRALELRMEHAEAASREHREAVLVQLERLASRIEWRLQRLEADHEETAAAAVGGGAQVVPIRSSGDV